MIIHLSLHARGSNPENYVLITKYPCPRPLFLGLLWGERSPNRLKFVGHNSAHQKLSYIDIAWKIAYVMTGTMLKYLIA